MIKLDQNGLPTDQTGDSMDSALRAAILRIFDGKIKISAYESDGFLCRHPYSYPSSNVNNMTRDNSIPLIAALPPEAVRRVFWRQLRRGFLFQNKERDVHGSIKYRWPHDFYKDSRPSATTVKRQFDFQTFRFKILLPAIEGGEIESRWFDMADVSMPDHVWHLIRCARLWPLYWFALVGVPFFCLSLFIHSRSSHREHNQIISQAKVNGVWATRLFKKLVPKWKEDLMEYWGSRNEIEYATIIIRWMENI